MKRPNKKKVEKSISKRNIRLKKQITKESNSYIPKPRVRDNNSSNSDSTTTTNED